MHLLAQPWHNGRDSLTSSSIGPNLLNPPRVEEGGIDSVAAFDVGHLPVELEG
jgi:hypothetical protein